MFPKTKRRAVVRNASSRKRMEGAELEFARSLAYGERTQVDAQPLSLHGCPTNRAVAQRCAGMGVLVSEQTWRVSTRLPTRHAFCVFPGRDWRDECYVDP